MKTYFVVLLLTISFINCFDRIPERNDDIPYVIENCEDSSDISFHETCNQCDIRTHRCYHINVDGMNHYPAGGFCKMVDPTHGIEPGVVSYTMSVYLDTFYLRAGSGIYFNYHDPNNFEIVYKIDYASSVCIVGYVEEGLTHNTTTFQCRRYQSCEFIEQVVEVTSETVHFSGHFNSSTALDTFTFKPHFPLVAKAGPMAVNSFGNNILHPMEIYMDTKTCADEPSSPLCDQCVFAYNVQSVPEYPLPNYNNMLLWNSRAMEMVYSACYIKVVIDLPDEQVVNVASKVGQFSYQAQNPDEEDINPGDLYGERNRCTENMAACIEVKYGGDVTDGDVQYLDKTLVEMRLDNSTSLTSSQVNHNLELLYNEDIVKHTPHEFHMYIQEHVYGADFGIYCYTVQGSAITAQKSAYNMCAAGNNDALQPPPESINQDNWAVRFS